MSDRSVGHPSLPGMLSRGDAVSSRNYFGRRTRALPRNHRMADLLTQLRRDALAGDRGALEELLARLHHAISRMLQRRLGHGPVATDITLDAAQQATVQVMRALAECRAETDAQLMAWALRIGWNCATDQLRFNLPKYAGVLLTSGDGCIANLGEATDEPPTPALASLTEILQSELEKLDADKVRLIWLRVWEELTWQEVGARFGVSSSAAKRRWQRLSHRLQMRVLERVRRLPPSQASPLLHWLGAEEQDAGRGPQ